MDLLNYYTQRRDIANEKMADTVKNINMAVNDLADYINSESHTPENVISTTEMLRNNLSRYIDEFKSAKTERELLEGLCMSLKNEKL